MLMPRAYAAPRDSAEDPRVGGAGRVAHAEGVGCLTRVVEPGVARPAARCGRGPRTRPSLGVGVAVEEPTRTVRARVRTDERPEAWRVIGLEQVCELVHEDVVGDP